MRSVPAQAQTHQEIREMHKTARRPGFGIAMLCAALAIGAAAPLNAEAADPAPSKKSSAKKQRFWQIGEFTTVRLVDKEAGSASNEHPSTLNAEGLRIQLATAQVTARGQTEALFGTEELVEIIPALVQAFSEASPSDDVLLLSTSRRGAGLLATPYGITARLFVQGGGLHLIVHDGRLDFVNAYRGTQILPTFVYGSRAKAGVDSLRSPVAASRRADWLVFALNAPAPALAPAAAPAVVAPVAASVKPEAAAAPAAAQSPARTPDAAFYEAQGERLKGLKRLRDQGLISEDEYQQKRREIMQTL
jgi:hypothetical protein